MVQSVHGRYELRNRAPPSQINVILFDAKFDLPETKYKHNKYRLKTDKLASI